MDIPARYHGLEILADCISLLGMSQFEYWLDELTLLLCFCPDNFFHYSGVSSLSFCLSQRVPRRWRQWKNLSWGRTCVLLVLFDSCVTPPGIFCVYLTACPFQLAFRIFLWVAIGLSNIDVLNNQSWFVVIWNRPLVVPHDLCSSCLRMYQLLCPQQSRSDSFTSYDFELIAVKIFIYAFLSEKVRPLPIIRNPRLTQQ